MGELSAGSSACLRRLPLFLCSPPACLHRLTPTDIFIYATALGLVAPWTLAWTILWLKAALRTAMGREKDGDARGRLRQWVCAAFWVTNSGETSLLESSPRGNLLHP